MCCVCNLLCKLISLAISLLFIVAVILLILWAVGILFGTDDNPTVNSRHTRSLFDSSRKFISAY